MLLNLNFCSTRSRLRAFGLSAFLGLFASVSANALTLSSGELMAAKELGCVLAEDALGYLNESQFNNRFDAAVADFSEEQTDVIYAKALGYIDGLLFGVPNGEEAAAAQRLEALSSSEACSRFAPVSYNSVSL